jgi:WD40 repeat protein
VTPNGKFILSASNDKIVQLWQSKDLACRHVFQGHSDAVNCVAVTPDSRFFISGSRDCTLKLWDLKNGDCLRTLKGHSDAVNSVAISSEGAYAVSGSSDHDLRKWNIRTGECLQVFKGHPACEDRDGLNSLIRSSNSGFSYHNYIGHLDVSTTFSQEDFTFFGHADPVTAVALSPDDRFVLSGSEDNTLRLWQTKTGKCLWIFGGRHGGTCFGVIAMVITPNGKFVISASEAIQSWRLTNRKFRRLFWGFMNEKPYRQFKGTKGMLGDMTVMPNGKHIAVIENNGKFIGIYAIKTSKLLRHIEVSADQAGTIAIAPDGRLLVAGCMSGAIHTWKLSQYGS